MKKLALLLMIVGIACWMSTTVEGSSPHTARGCSSCHVPHHAQPEGDRMYGVPLWALHTGTGELMDPEQAVDASGDPVVDANGQPVYVAGTAFTLYQPVVWDDPSLATLDAVLEQPNGPTLLCLACHDGTYPYIREGRDNGDPIMIPNPDYIDPIQTPDEDETIQDRDEWGNKLYEQGPKNGTWPTRFLPTDGLAHTHPVSFKYDPVAAVDDEIYPSTTNVPALGGTIGEKMLDSRGRMQCTSCHDAHNSAWGTQNLIMNPGSGTGGGAICKTCHNK